MAKIIKFPARIGIQPLRVPSKPVHKVRLRVVEKRHSDLTRWEAQYAIQRGCGFRGLKGWTNECARNGDWFTCRVSDRLIARFVRDMNLAVRSGTLEVSIDKQPLRLVA
jgi:hypothetical protein